MQAQQNRGRGGCSFEGLKFEKQKTEYIKKESQSKGPIDNVSLGFWIGYYALL